MYGSLSLRIAVRGIDSQILDTNDWLASDRGSPRMSELTTMSVAPLDLVDAAFWIGLTRCRAKFRLFDFRRRRRLQTW